MKDFLSIIFLLLSVNSLAQVDSHKLPTEKIEIELYTYFSDGSSEKTYNFGPSTEDTTALKLFNDKMSKKADSAFLIASLDHLSQYKQGTINFKEAIGVQVLAKLIGKTSKRYKAEITINDKLREVVDVNFLKYDTIRRDMTHICFKTLKNLYALQVTIFNEADRVDSFYGYHNNGHFNRFWLVSIFPGDRIDSKVPMHFSDSLKLYDWLETYKVSELDTSMIWRKLGFDSSQNKYFVERKSVCYPEILFAKTNQEYYFWFEGVPKNIDLEYKIVPWEIYDDSVIPWKKNNLQNSLVKVSIDQPGIHLLRVRNPDYTKMEFEYKIIVQPQWFQTLAFKITIGSLMALSVFSLFFVFYRRKQKQKFKFLEKQKNEIDISLSSMRSQLNPHFIFNALNSIQGLISSTQYDKASEYLVDFSCLLRKPLNPEDIKHWTLSDEIELLNTYIKLEQLRTPFQHELVVDELLITNQITFPALLLQPLVENAIKHGLPKATNPKLFISVQKKNHDLIIFMKDNGNGFDVDQPQTGNGLKLSKEYMELINKQFPQSNTSINFDSNKNGTTVIITFQNWLDE